MTAATTLASMRYHATRRRIGYSLKKVPEAIILSILVTLVASLIYMIGALVFKPDPYDPEYVGGIKLATTLQLAKDYANMTATEIENSRPVEDAQRIAYAMGESLSPYSRVNVYQDMVSMSINSKECEAMKETHPSIVLGKFDERASVTCDPVREELYVRFNNKEIAR